MRLCGGVYVVRLQESGLTLLRPFTCGRLDDGDGGRIPCHRVLGRCDCCMYVCYDSARLRDFPVLGPRVVALIVRAQGQQSSLDDIDDDGDGTNGTHMTSKTPRSLSATSLPCSPPRWLDKKKLRNADVMSIPAVTPELVQNLSDTTHLRGCQPPLRLVFCPERGTVNLLTLLSAPIRRRSQRCVPAGQRAMRSQVRGDEPRKTCMPPCSSWLAVPAAPPSRREASCPCILFIRQPAS